MKTLTETQIKKLGELFESESAWAQDMDEMTEVIDKETFLRLAPQISEIVEQPASEPPYKVDKICQSCKYYSKIRI